MHFDLYHWLFDDAITAGNNGNLPGAEQFHFFWPYLIFCGFGLLIWFYYWVEGRKRFVKNKPIVKYMMDRYLNWLAIICFIGIPIALARVTLEGFFFSWRFWRYGWALALLIWAVLWIVYLVRKFPAESANYRAYQARQQYIPKPKRAKGKVRAASR